MTLVDLNTTVEELLQMHERTLRFVYGLKFSEAFLEKYMDMIDWGDINPREQTHLSEAFMEKHWNYLYVFFLKTERLSNAFIIKMARQYGCKDLIGHKQISTELVELFLNDKKIKTTEKEKQRIISGYPDLSETLLEAMIKQNSGLVSDILTHQQHLSNAFIAKYCGPYKSRSSNADLYLIFDQIRRIPVCFEGNTYSVTCDIVTLKTQPWAIFYGRERERKRTLLELITE